MNKFKERLKELRQEKDLTQKDLSIILGFGRTTVNDWETKGTEPDIDTLLAIANYFQVSTDYLLGNED